MFGPLATEFAEVRHVDVSSLGDSRCGRWQVFLQAFETTLREQLETMMRNSFRARAGPFLLPSLFRGREQMESESAQCSTQIKGSWSEFSR